MTPRADVSEGVTTAVKSRRRASNSAIALRPSSKAKLPPTTRPSSRGDARGGQGLLVALQPVHGRPDLGIAAHAGDALVPEADEVLGGQASGRDVLTAHERGLEPFDGQSTRTNGKSCSCMSR